MARDKDRLAALQAAHRAKNFRLFVEFLSEHPCVDCSEADPIVLEFDHLPGVEKRFNISTAVTGSTRSWALILSEIEKCEVVCANCHRRRTAKRASHRKHLIDAGVFEHPVPLAPGRRVVGHGQGLKGKHNCPCDLCRNKRREYAADRRKAQRSF
ncbi:hypothetical protein ACTU6U_06995 [Microbacterium sp. A196]|uniref:hypothetical protein n=1 Tax=Microbacterium sp. A196 TaxID=3457320 RepID=UPI003FD08C72